MSSGEIKIIKLPFGPGPKNIKQMFIGLTFRPFGCVDSKTLRPISVATGKRVTLPNERVYIVHFGQVLKTLETERPEAYKWFVENSTLFTDGELNGTYRMYFEASACEILGAIDLLL